MRMLKKMAKMGVGNLEILTRDWNEYGRHFGNALSLKNSSRKGLEFLQMSVYLKFFLRASKINALLKNIKLKALVVYLLYQIRNYLFVR